MAQLRTVETSRGTRYVVRWSWYVDKDARKEGTRSFNRLDAAKEFKAKKELAQDHSPVSASDGKRTVSYWADRWLTTRETEVERGKIRVSTLHSNRQIVELTVKPLLGERRIRSLTVDDIEEWLEAVHKGRTPGTVKHHFGVLSQILSFAVRKRAITTNPAREVSVQVEDVNREPFEGTALTEAEVHKLAAAAEALFPGTPYPLLIKFMAYTGLRAGEVAGLNVADLHLIRAATDPTNIKRAWVDVHQIRVKGKGATGFRTARPKKGRKRRVPVLPPWLMQELAAYLDAHPNTEQPDAPLWPGMTAERRNTAQADRANAHATALWVSVPDYTKPWDRDPFYKRQFKQALRAAGLPAIRLHDLRHTAITNWLLRDVPDYRAAEYAGHSVDVLRKTYSHVRTTDTDLDFDLYATHASAPALGGVGDNVTALHKGA